MKPMSMVCGAPPRARLSSAEESIVVLLATGARTREIARVRGVAPGTIANQIASARLKLGAPSRRELVLAWGLGPSASRDEQRE